MVGMNDRRGVMVVMIDDGMDTTRWGGGGLKAVMMWWLMWCDGCFDDGFSSNGEGSRIEFGSRS